MLNSEKVLSSIESNDEECILDLQLKSYVRNTYAGACAIEFLSQLETLISKVICWNDKVAIGRPGIFGKSEAYGVAIEEQGQKTLHGHILV